MIEKAPDKQMDVTDSLKEVLSAVRFAKPIPATLLNDLAVVKLISMCDDSLFPIDIMIVEWLNQLIEENLTYYRQLYQLRLPNYEDTREDLIYILGRDFQYSNEYLEAWSVLYHRYVRVDLNLSTNEFEDITLMSDRTLRRRQNLGYDLLSKEIFLLESGFHRIFEW